MIRPEIGGVKLNSRVLLAPMAGLTDRAYRELCMRHGAACCFSEMVSAKALSFRSKKSEELMALSDCERPCGVQLFGDDPDCIAEAAVHALKNSPDFIDVNMGCPAPKISGNGSGSALMRDPDLCGDIVRAVKRVSTVPVTVKIRKGWDDASVNAVEVAVICEKAGASAITVHGRTRQQYYKPPVDYEIIRQVREAVSVPVIANGDIDSPQKAKAVMEQTGCELVMVGRASMGNPWIFEQINAYLEDPGAVLHKPSLDEKLDTMVRQVSDMVRYKGEYIAIRQARKLVVGYFKGMKGAAALRNEAGRIETIDDLIRLRNRIIT
ncbi:MAG: tRNA dihydrouridine synthase DusB [Ruminococcus sp.]|nr:tRNA dihydrouridine synthase DusB [Ruminococcus sp.]